MRIVANALPNRCSAAGFCFAFSSAPSVTALDGGASSSKQRGSACTLPALSRLFLEEPGSCRRRYCNKTQDNCCQDESLIPRAQLLPKHNILRQTNKPASQPVYPSCPVLPPFHPLAHRILPEQPSSPPLFPAIVHRHTAATEPEPLKIAEISGWPVSKYQMQSCRQAMRSSPHGPSSSSSSSSHHDRTPSSSSASSTSSQRTATNVATSTSTIKLVPTTPSPRTPGSTHHSPGAQGYFEPTLMHTPSAQPQASAQAPSQMAAAFAMASQRKRSATAPSPTSPPVMPSALTAAGAAANAAFPRERESVPPTPGSDTSSPPMIGHAILHPPPPIPLAAQPSPPLTTHSAPPTAKKESSKMKLFSKPGRIGTPTVEKALRPPPSPNKIPNISSPIPRLAPSSTISASDRKPSLSAAIHSSASTAALISATQDVLHPFPSASSSISGYSSSPPAKDHSHSHKPHFLRARRDKDHANVTFSSSASNSKAISADGSSLYSFGPSSPSSAVFGSSSKVDLQKTISGIDISSSSKSSKAFKGGASWEEAFSENSGLGTGVQLAENAWTFSRSRVLGLFEGEPLKNTVEDLNRLVVLHIKRCYDRRSAIILVEDVRDLLDTGMATIDPTLKAYQDEKLIGRLVEIWGLLFGNILPYFEAVFLPLQQEFKGVGTVMSSRESREFFAEVSLPGERLDVRRLALVSFRDKVILPLYSKLEVLFSTLQLDFSVSQSQITENAGKMLQCISVLSSVLTGDEAQEKIDALAKTLKHNWLSRGRTGRNRRGFVGTKALKAVV